jgi:ABC-type polysaccharide/polyol phosphate transport system ATPase subunit
MKPILQLENVSKKYRIRHQREPYLSLRERLLDILRTGKSDSEDFYALDNVSFDVEAGASLGIIGRNGAGKSTLLKILSKITPPTKGRIVTRGRIASLLEVGTGFHPELTGRENVFFNGSLLGMKRREISNKFDAIVDFSGIEKFLDTPLKHFSSGMQLRLAFSVAAFLEPEILVVDEVLAVGDAEFQRKCLGKMEDVSRNGRTILFVSHDLEAVEKLCSNTLLLDSGKIMTMGPSAQVIDKYVQHGRKDFVQYQLSRGVRLVKFRFGQDRSISGKGLPFDIAINLEAGDVSIRDFCILIHTMRGYRVAIVDFRPKISQFRTNEGTIAVRGVIDRLNLVEGEYQFGLYYCINDTIGEVTDLSKVTVSDVDNVQVNRYKPQYRGVVELGFSIEE